MTTSPWIIAPTEADFQQLVVERSRELPVVVDFWSPRCGPCLALAPLLEKHAEQAEGKFLLAKVNCDEAPALASAFGVSSIPAVFAVRDGKVLDYFVGGIGEEQLARWLEGIQPGPAEQLVAEARRLKTSDPALAAGKFKEAIALAPTQSAWQIELARLLLDDGRLDDCRAVIDELAERGFLEEEAQDVQAAMALKAAAKESPSAQCRAAAEKKPKDLALKLRLAESLAGEGAYDEALEICLNLVQVDRKGVGEAAIESMKRIFRVMGNDDERTTSYRRKLASAMY